MAKKGFWGKFSDLMNALPEYIDSEINTIGEDNKISTKGSSLFQSSKYSSSTSTIVQGGKNIKIVTKNGKTTITVNGKEYIEKNESL